MKFIFFFILIFLLSSCFLGQTKPTFSESKEKYTGLLRLESYYGLIKGTLIDAYFEIDSQRKIFEVMNLRTQCNIVEISKKPDRTYNIKSIGSSDFVSIGKLVFHTQLQSSVEELIQFDDNTYHLELSDSFPSGTYIIHSELLGELGYLVVPEEVHELELNGSNFYSTIVIRKNEPIVAVWAKPLVQNEEYVVLLDIEINQDGKKFLFRCVEFEKSLEKANDKTKWLIPTEKLSNFPDGTGAKLYFSRASIYEYTKKRSTVQLQGFRTHFGLTQIFN